MSFLRSFFRGELACSPPTASVLVTTEIQYTSKIFDIEAFRAQEWTKEKRPESTTLQKILQCRETRIRVTLASSHRQGKPVNNFYILTLLGDLIRLSALCISSNNIKSKCKFFITKTKNLERPEDFSCLVFADFFKRGKVFHFMFNFESRLSCIQLDAHKDTPLYQDQIYYSELSITRIPI